MPLRDPDNQRLMFELIEEHDRHLPFGDRPTKRKHVIPAYLFIALAVALGWWAVDSNSQHDIDRNSATIVEIVCGLKFFVTDLIEAGSEREAVLEKLDARLPRGATCVDPLVPDADP